MNNSNIILLFSACVSSIATVVIAVYAIFSYRLSKKIEGDSSRFQQETKDLYQAIVIATILGEKWSVGDPSLAIKRFNELYKGKTKIF